MIDALREPADDRGAMKLKIKARGRKKRVLNSAGKVGVRATVTFAPTGGTPRSQTRRVKLIKR